MRICCSLQLPFCPKPSVSVSLRVVQELAVSEVRTLEFLIPNRDTESIIRKLAHHHTITSHSDHIPRFAQAMVIDSW
jgi:hypothetical protein